ncbi:MAG TPA: hypothetical protein VNE39_02510 [Planctomycetota bacterium]|nr:hypothetical protein [Planctomycetota bacterium]
MRARAAFLAAWVLAGLVGAAQAAGPAPARDLRRRVYAHYMGCFCAGTDAIWYHAHSGLGAMDFPGEVTRQKDPLKRDIASVINRAKNAPSFGGTYRNFALAPFGKGKLPREVAADLEIRRAMRIGIDGFTFDAWAGGQSARDLLDLMFKICEEKDYPFELTVTLDTTCLDPKDPGLRQYEGNQWVKTLKWLVDKHGKSPKLARRDGKLLVLGYQSAWPWVGHLWDRVGKRIGWDDKAKIEAEVMRLRSTPEGWALVGEAYREIERQVGQPIYWEFCLSAFEHALTPAARENLKPFAPDPRVKAVEIIAKELPAVGMFLWEGKDVPGVAKAALAAGAEWCHPMKLQYENYGWLQIASPGLDWVRGDWAAAREWPSTLIQLITWNDYHENTNLSPGINTRYAYYDLTGYFIRWWKTGKPPEPDHDRFYIFSHKYTHGSKIFPFKEKTRADNVIEVLTILPKPARMRLPGRDAEWDAPAGMAFKQVALAAGPVVAELLRDGKVEIRLEHPEPVGDRPFRQDTGKTAISTEEARLWREDFGDKEPMYVYSEYGDADGDGLPNWFEMLWFGKFGDMATATVADPNADPDGDGRTSLQEWRDQTDPTQPPATPPKASEPKL